MIFLLRLNKNCHVLWGLNTELCNNFKLKSISNIRNTEKSSGSVFLSRFPHIIHYSHDFWFLWNCFSLFYKMFEGCNRNIVVVFKSISFNTAEYIYLVVSYGLDREYWQYTTSDHRSDMPRWWQSIWSGPWNVQFRWCGIYIFWPMGMSSYYTWQGVGNQSYNTVYLEHWVECHMHVWGFSEFVSYVIQVGAVIVYTFVYHMLAPPKDAIAQHENEESCDEIDIKVESMNSEHANGFSGSILLEDIQKDDSMSVPLLLPQSSDTLLKVRVTNSVFNSLKSCCMLGVCMTTLPNLDISTWQMLERSWIVYFSSCCAYKAIHFTWKLTAYSYILSLIFFF